jgi:hypothetical protein
MDEMVMGAIIGSGAANAGHAVNNIGVAGSIYRFIPLKNFTAEVKGQPTEYVKGMRYNVHPDNMVLMQLVEEWVQNGKVERVK